MVWWFFDQDGSLGSTSKRPSNSGRSLELPIDPAQRTKERFLPTVEMTNSEKITGLGSQDRGAKRYGPRSKIINSAAP
jgi:hypothetical protein